MAVLKCEFFSTALQRIVPFRAVLSNDIPDMMKMGNPHYDREAKTMYLLHGFSGCDSDWLYQAPLMDLAARYHINFILPAGENRFYLNGSESDRKHADYIGQELPEYVSKLFGLSDRAEDTFIGGVSMGGFGALHTGLMFPEKFSKIMALSSALIIYDIKGMAEGTENEVANYEYYRTVFGDLEEVDLGENNPEVLARRLKEADQGIPDIYMAVGTEDFLYENNQIFRRFLEQQQILFRYEEGAGMHDFAFWNQHLEPAIQWFLGEQKDGGRG